MMYRHRQLRGFCLTELLIAMTLTTFSIALALRFYAHTRQAIQTQQNLIEMEQRAAFALTLLEQDVQLAGFWGLHADSARLAVETGINIHCGGSDITGWGLQLHTSIDTGSTPPCPAVDNAAADSVVLVTRHASALPTNARNGSIQLQTGVAGGRIFADGSTVVSTTVNRVHDLQLHAWFIGAQSSAANMPALRRYTLVHGGLLQNQEMMPGIEQLNVVFGIDLDGDQQTDAFVPNPGAHNQSVLAARIVLTVRALQPESDYVDPLHHDHYRRLQSERTVLIRNHL
jgi:type IV pilus assembly protein PilW